MSEDNQSPRDPSLEAGYATLLGTYGTLAAVTTLLLRRRAKGFVPLKPFELLTYGLATQHIARVITKDEITSVVRAPFTEYKEPAGEGEVNEEVKGSGLRHAVGELISCPFCIGQWVATGLMAGRVGAPQFTAVVVGASAAARLSDYLQLAYARLR